MSCELYENDTLRYDNENYSLLIINYSLFIEFFVK